MKKDFEIPVAKEVIVAIVREWNEEFQCHDWNAYLINNKDTAIEMVFVTTKGFDNKVKTSVMRHGLGTVQSKSSVKIELIQEDLLKLNNEFFVTFFGLDGVLYERRFLFRKNTINEKATQEIPLLKSRGVLCN
ncbi:hypothetical protein [Zhouia amylolytica]|uniref:Phenylalanyl-tRNA synthetase subunit alpha n=1 Tax=Zhouia amylolytica AD3 TaxID=1286632 RepID=W2UL34_9FLAO|nr:hypothetical protein [Zhouia amylolytica]ETN94694.1 hypothetical protein P278_26370 [Zhouia amylolytica AD3]